MAEQPPAKKARTEFQVPPFTAVKLDDFSLKDKGKGKNGGHVVFPLIGGNEIRFNLTPVDWLKTPFGFDVSSKYENPSFLGGKEPERAGTPEGLSLRINAPQAEMEFLGKLDEAAQTALPDIVKATWNPLLSDNQLYKTTSFKVNVVLKGDGLTQIAVVADGQVVRGEGWDFLKTYIDSGNTFRQADVKLTSRVKKLWNVASKAGLSLEATQLVLRVHERPKEASAFSDDWALLQ